MGTNYYVANIKYYAVLRGPHVGKRYSAGQGKTGWIWAIEPLEFMFHVQIGKKFLDEYGTIFQAGDMYRLINQCSLQTTESIGADFT